MKQCHEIILQKLSKKKPPTWRKGCESTEMFATDLSVTFSNVILVQKSGVA
ncbi:MAG: hypothetical protein KA388_04830 [Rhodocyclaceae bacterium]|nr:hypothetical protein [Rhodocyclaceae bacterium]MBP6110023.1 hypothetical protein [Rhodocyclaceae bacterium]MBP6279066.1 hypothetical protein [Rhodocyclaceae bacterium]